MKHVSSGTILRGWLPDRLTASTQHSITLGFSEEFMENHLQNIKVADKFFKFFTSSSIEVVHLSRGRKL